MRQKFYLGLAVCLWSMHAGALECEKTWTGSQQYNYLPGFAKINLSYCCSEYPTRAQFQDFLLDESNPLSMGRECTKIIDPNERNGTQGVLISEIIPSEPQNNGLCDDDEDKVWLYGICADTREILATLETKVFPNPTTGKVFMTFATSTPALPDKLLYVETRTGIFPIIPKPKIDLSIDLTGAYYNVVNMLGQVVMDGGQVQWVQAGEQKYMIDITELPTGTYYIWIEVPALGVQTYIKAQKVDE